ncbi:MAG: hypothetical protein ACRD1H_14080 [Vicinamibacterales bacterium]
METGTDTAAGNPAEGTPPPPTCRWLILALIIAIGWWAALGSLALFTANPVTLNRAQIEQAELVVEAAVPDDPGAPLSVRRAWKDGAGLKSVTILELDQTEAQAGQTYLFPLVAAGNDRYRIARGRVSVSAVARSGEVAAFGGRVVEGRAEVVEPGERNAAAKQPGDRIVPGSRILDGELKLSASRELPPAIYPATPEAVEQLQRILDDDR